MTKEKAITIIESHKAHWQRLLREKICDETEGRETIEGFDMAISALSENEGDLISRKSLLNKINAYVVGSQDKEFICKLIKEMPSVEPIGVQEAYYEGMIDGINECTAKLEKFNEKLANCGADMRGET